MKGPITNRYKNMQFIRVYYIEFPIRIRGFPGEIRYFWPFVGTPDCGLPIDKHRSSVLQPLMELMEKAVMQELAQFNRGRQYIYV